MKTKKKKRNPTDVTFRNLNALKERVLKLEAQVAALEHNAGVAAPDDLVRIKTAPRGSFP